MKKILLSLCAFLPLFSFGQASEINSVSRLAVGFVFSPDHCYRSLKFDDASKWIGDHRNEREIPKFGFTTGASILYTLNKRVSLESGLLLSNKGEKLKEEFINNPEFYADANGVSPLSWRHTYHYLYLDVPTKINYYLLTGKVKLFISAGISTNIFLTQLTKQEVKFSDGRTDVHKDFNNHPYDYYTGFKRLNLVGLAGLGAEYNLSDNFHLRIEPIYRRSITPINNTSIKSYLTSTGVNLGVYYKL